MLPDYIEEELARFLIEMCQIGYGVTKGEIPGIVKSILDKGNNSSNERYTSKYFKNNTPSISWVYKFLKRTPSVCCRIPENLGILRAHVTESTIQQWFKRFEMFLKNEHNIDAKEFLTPENSGRIYNVDESGFPLNGTAGQLKVVALRGAKNVTRIVSESKTQISVLGCADASGILHKPLIIFPGVRPKINFGSAEASHFNLAFSSNGWISSDIFFGWLANIFYPSIQHSNIFPVILLMDGHSSHINLAVAEFCREKHIILYCLLPHASHIMQPLDVAVYGPLKKYWNQEINSFLRSGEIVTKSNFIPIFDKVWKKATSNKENILSGFKKSGIVPFNEKAIDYSKIPDNRVKNTTPIKNVSRDELVGMIRMYRSADLLALFRDMDKDSICNEHDNILFAIYEKMNEVLKQTKDSSAMPLPQSVSGNYSIYDTLYNSYECTYNVHNVL